MRIATANGYIFWLEKDVWTAREAIILFIGLVPTSISAGYSMQGEYYDAYLGIQDLVKKDFSGIDFRQIKKSPSEWINWAKSRRLKVEKKFSDAVKDAGLYPESTTDERSASGKGKSNFRSGTHQWPWGSYQTKLLNKLAMAAEKYWTRYDPEDATTAHTNEEVSKYLQSQGVSERVADIMAQILRADGLRPGPRK